MTRRIFAICGFLLITGLAARYAFEKAWVSCCGSDVCRRQHHHEVN